MNIFIVDDDEVNTRLFGEMLGFLGYQVRSAASPEEVLARLEEYAPDLILMDYLLPNMSGLQLAKKIKQSMDVPIVIVSGYTRDECKEQEYLVYADGWLTKPVTMDQLHNTIENIMASVHIGGELPE